MTVRQLGLFLAWHLPLTLDDKEVFSEGNEYGESVLEAVDSIYLEDGSVVLRSGRCSDHDHCLLRSTLPYQEEMHIYPMENEAVRAKREAAEQALLVGRHNFEMQKEEAAKTFNCRCIIEPLQEAIDDGAYAWIHDPEAVEKFNAELKNYLTPKRILELSQPLERIDEHED